MSARRIVDPVVVNELAARGMTAARIGRETGFAADTITRVAIKYGISLSGTRRLIDRSAVETMAAWGFPAKKIAEVQGFCPESIHFFAKIHGIELPAAVRSKQCDFWKENGNRAVQMIEDGKTTSHVAKVLGTTKNSVVGYLHRIGGCAAICNNYKPKARRVVSFPPAGRCQFPHGEPGKPDFHFCGEPAKAGSSFCTDHHAKCFYTPRA